MKKILLSTIAASTLLLATEYNYEVSPMIGYIDTAHNVDLKNHSIVGLAGYKNMDEECMFNQLELALFRATDVDYDNSNLDTAISLFSFNGIKEYKLNDTFNLYALAGLGYEKIQDEYFGNESDPFANYGVGIKAKLTDLVSVKLDARHLIKFDGDQNILYTAGLALSFGGKAHKAPEVQAPKKIHEVPKQPKIEEKKPIVLDGDNDGVVDSQDLCPNSLPKAKVNKEGCEAIIDPIDLGVQFDTDSAKIRKTDLEKFYPFIEYAKYVKEGKVLIEAHTDDVGKDKYNMGLSHRRALSVKKQLISMGVDKDRIITKGYGETKPKVPNTSAENRQINRRVEAKIIR
jgi:OmpA-OmpF porin, OOP family